MDLQLKDFQRDALVEMSKCFASAQGLVAGNQQAAVLLNAPTGSGKTVIMTALIDELLGGNADGSEGDTELVFLWLTDDPELNLQSAEKMLATSSVLTAFSVIPIDTRVNAETFIPGKVYFLNTQKLASSTSYVKRGDGREYTLWAMVRNTISQDKTKFVLIIDEAHRGARGREATEAETIMQVFVKGNGQLPEAVPLVIGVSATPKRFVDLCGSMNRPLLRVDVPPEEVRESGLLKEFIDLYHPDEAQPSQVTMLNGAIDAWNEYCTRWRAYGKSQGETVPEPVLLVQVEDTKAGSGKASRTDLGMVVSTLLDKMKRIDHEFIAHAFQEGTAVEVDGRNIRYIAPSRIEADSDVKVVLFKTSLNTGWDCPRAEVMVSFRTARDETNIAQLVGRMVRAPMARRIDADEHLNTVALYLPFYDADAVDKVVTRLTGDPDLVPPMEVRKGRTGMSLIRASGADECFKLMEALPTYTVPRLVRSSPISRLGKLAALLAELELETDPVKSYRAELADSLQNQRAALDEDPDFRLLTSEAGLLEIRRRRIALAASDTGQAKSLESKAIVDDVDLERLFSDSGRLLGEGLHKEYLRRRILIDQTDGRTARIELCALVQAPGVLASINAHADTKRHEWVTDHKAAINRLGDKYKQILRDIEGGGDSPELTSISMPNEIEARSGTTVWDKHIYVDPETGKFPAEFNSSWERKTIKAELENKSVVWWLRNLDRKPWSVCAPRRHGARWRGIYPDFIFFRQTESGIIADIVDPHLLNDQHAPVRAAALAEYANRHVADYGRIEMVIYENKEDDTGKRIDLMNPSLRDRVAKVRDHAHLKDIFDNP